MKTSFSIALGIIIFGFLASLIIGILGFREIAVKIQYWCLAPIPLLIVLAIFLGVMKDGEER